MNDQSVMDRPVMVPKAAARQPWSAFIRKSVAHVMATAVALAFVAGLLSIGLATGWSLPKFSDMRGVSGPDKDDWCTEHSVPESICVECKKKDAGHNKDLGWCRVHGVHDCPHCRADVAQTPASTVATDEDRERSARALAFSPRVENNSKCNLHERRIQFANDEVISRLGIEVVPAGLAAVTESVSAPGEIAFDPTRIARLSSRVPGSVWWVARQVGDKVKREEVLALVDAAEVGKAKADFQQAIVQLDLKRQTLANLSSSTGAITGRQVQDAEAAVEEGQIRLLQTEQSLANLGMPIRAESLKGLNPAEVASKLQFLGLPAALVSQLAGRTGSNNLIAITAPFDGEVIAKAAVAGELADPAKPLFTVADISRMWLTLKARLEDANRIKPGARVRFQHVGHEGWDDGTVDWISPAADEKTRTVAVRVEMPNPTGRHHANTFGTAEVVLRDEPKALVVPSEAVHWEGDCNVVFVRDKNFDKPDGLKVFHVRKVRPGAQDVASTGPITEIAAGLLPGEFVATTNSGILRTELLKNNLGAG